MSNQVLPQETHSLRAGWAILLLTLGSGGAHIYAQPVLSAQLTIGSHPGPLHAASAIHTASGAWHPFYMPYGWIGPVYPVPSFYADCFLFPNCTIFAPYPPQMARRQKSPPPAKAYGEPYQPDAAMEAWRASLRPMPAPFRTDEHLIQPQFRDHSLIRPEFEQTGRPLPIFLPK